MKIKRPISVFLAVLSGVCFGVTVSTYLLTNGYLSKNYRAYIVQSGSMEPTLPVGSIVFTKSADTYSTGDVVTFSAQDKKTLVTHRIVSEAEENGTLVYKTKGDANEDQDNWSINKEQIVGKSLFAVPKLGYLADFIKTPKGFVALVVIPASIIIYEEIKNVLREIKRAAFKKKDKEDNKSKTSMFIPIMGIFLLMISSTQAFSMDRETSHNNSFKASNNFQEVQKQDEDNGGI